MHPFTIYFIKNNPAAILALLGQPNHDVALIQRLTKNLNWPQATRLYKSIPSNMQFDEQKTLNDVLETNFVMNFNRLANNGVILGIYRTMKKAFGHVTMDNMQMRPDMVSFWFGSLYKYQGYLGVDLKYKVVKNFGRNQVLVNPQIAYEDIIDNFLLGLEKKNIVTQEMREVLQSLKDSSNNFDAHITVWEITFIYFLKDGSHLYY